MTVRQPSETADDSSRYAAIGVVMGFLVGGVVTLLTLPKTGEKPASQGLAEVAQTVRERVEMALPVDPVSESMAEGKAAARRRRDELGMR